MTKRKIEDLSKYVEPATWLEPVYATPFQFTAIVSGVDEKTLETNAYPGVYIDPISGVYYIKNGKVGYADGVGESRTTLKPEDWLIYRKGKTVPETAAAFNGIKYPTNLKKYYVKSFSEPNYEGASVLAYQVTEVPKEGKYQEERDWEKLHYGLSIHSRRAFIYPHTKYAESIEVLPGSWVVFKYESLHGVWSDEYFREKYDVSIVPDDNTLTWSVSTTIPAAGTPTTLAPPTMKVKTGKAAAAPTTVTKADIRKLSDYTMKVVTILDQIEQRLS